MVKGCIVRDLVDDLSMPDGYKLLKGYGMLTTGQLEGFSSGDASGGYVKVNFEICGKTDKPQRD